MSRRTLTDAQKRRRAANRAKYSRLHAEYVDRGDRASQRHPDAAREYYAQAQEYYQLYRQNGGRSY